ncbi:MAG: AAA family ATPase, partial [Firmicutes bacterium]|nr:AAA family ATPase [Bacillota bacterium]
MRVEYVEIRDLRNYSHVFFSPLPGRNVLLGENASGKTSVIEAIFLGLCGYSFRTSREEEMVRFGAGQGAVRASIVKQG